MRLQQVLIAVRHPAMRRLIVDLVEVLGREVVVATASGQSITRYAPLGHGDVIIIDDSLFVEVSRAGQTVPPEVAVIVIGPASDSAYHQAALASGANGWLSPDRLGEDLGAELARVARPRTDA